MMSVGICTMYTLTVLRTFSCQHFGCERICCLPGAICCLPGTFVRCATPLFLCPNLISDIRKNDIFDCTFSGFVSRTNADWSAYSCLAMKIYDMTGLRRQRTKF